MNSNFINLLPNKDWLLDEIMEVTETDDEYETDEYRLLAGAEKKVKKHRKKKHKGFKQKKIGKEKEAKHKKKLKISKYGKRKKLPPGLEKNNDIRVSLDHLDDQIERSQSFSAKHSGSGRALPGSKVKATGPKISNEPEKMQTNGPDAISKFVYKLEKQQPQNEPKENAPRKEIKEKSNRSSQEILKETKVAEGKSKSGSAGIMKTETVSKTGETKNETGEAPKKIKEENVKQKNAIESKGDSGRINKSGKKEKKVKGASKKPKRREEIAKLHKESEKDPGEIGVENLAREEKKRSKSERALGSVRKSEKKKRKRKKKSGKSEGKMKIAQVQESEKASKKDKMDDEVIKSISESGKEEKKVKKKGKKSKGREETAKLHKESGKAPGQIGVENLALEQKKGRKSERDSGSVSESGRKGMKKKRKIKKSRGKRKIAQIFQELEGASKKDKTKFLALQKIDGSKFDRDKKITGESGEKRKKKRKKKKKEEELVKDSEKSENGMKKKKTKKDHSKITSKSRTKGGHKKHKKKHTPLDGTYAKMKKLKKRKKTKSGGKTKEADHSPRIGDEEEKRKEVDVDEGETGSTKKIEKDVLDEEENDDKAEEPEDKKGSTVPTSISVPTPGISSVTASTKTPAISSAVPSVSSSSDVPVSASILDTPTASTSPAMTSEKLDASPFPQGPTTSISSTTSHDTSSSTVATTEEGDLTQQKPELDGKTINQEQQFMKGQEKCTNKRKIMRIEAFVQDKGKLYDMTTMPQSDQLSGKESSDSGNAQEPSVISRSGLSSAQGINAATTTTGGSSSAQGLSAATTTSGSSSAQGIGAAMTTGGSNSAQEISAATTTSGSSSAQGISTATTTTGGLSSAKGISAVTTKTDGSRPQGINAATTTTTGADYSQTDLEDSEEEKENTSTNATDTPEKKIKSVRPSNDSQTSLDSSTEDQQVETSKNRNDQGITSGTSDENETDSQIPQKTAVTEGDEQGDERQAVDHKKRKTHKHKKKKKKKVKSKRIANDNNDEENDDVQQTELNNKSYADGLMEIRTLLEIHGMDTEKREAFEKLLDEDVLSDEEISKNLRKAVGDLPMDTKLLKKVLVKMEKSCLLTKKEYETLQKNLVPQAKNESVTLALLAQVLQRRRFKK